MCKLTGAMSATMRARSGAPLRPRVTSIDTHPPQRPPMLPTFTRDPVPAERLTHVPAEQLTNRVRRRVTKAVLQRGSRRSKELRHEKRLLSSQNPDDHREQLREPGRVIGRQPREELALQTARRAARARRAGRRRRHSAAARRGSEKLVMAPFGMHPSGRLTSPSVKPLS